MATFPDRPACVDADLHTALTGVQTAMDAVMAVLEEWNDGDLDGLQLSQAFDAATLALRRAKEDVGAALP